MMKYIYASLNNLLVAVLFILSTKIAERDIIYGLIVFCIAFPCLDLHSYIDKKLNYPNNIFIH
jgi:hypothetical protein